MDNYRLPNPHRRQFVIGSFPFKVYEHWKSQKLDDRNWISYCPDLKISWTIDRDCVHWCLLGLAVQTTTDTQPEAEIPNLSTNEVIDRYSSWAGRWLLVGNGQIHLDANGLLGCFYSRNSQGEIWVSSSTILLSQILETDESDERILSYEQGISWYTPPYSSFKKIARLLPSQILDFTSGEIIYRQLMPDIDLDGDCAKTISLVEDALVNTLRNLGKEGQSLWLGLTAGYDSRLMLAISVKAKIDFTTFTRVADRMSLADYILPPKLARKCRVPHLFLRNKPPKEQLARKQLVRDRCGYNVSDGDAEPFIMGVRDKLAGISFGGHGFAIASGFNNLRQLPATFESPSKGAGQIGELFNEPQDSSAVAGLTEWLTWVQSHPQKHLDWRDLFFLEQRQAGWLSSKEEVYDLTDLTRFPILNSARTYSLLLSIPEAQRLGSLVQVALLKRLAPELTEYPFNPPDDLFSRWLRIKTKTIINPKYLYWQIKAKITNDNN